MNEKSIKNVEREIQEVIETLVRPALQEDGGDVEFCSFRDGVVYVKLLGACSGCPMSYQTLQLRVEHVLCYYVPEVREVNALS